MSVNRPTLVVGTSSRAISGSCSLDTPASALKVVLSSAIRLIRLSTSRPGRWSDPLLTVAVPYKGGAVGLAALGLGAQAVGFLVGGLNGMAAGRAVSALAGAFLGLVMEAADDDANYQLSLADYENSLKRYRNDPAYKELS